MKDIIVLCSPSCGGKDTLLKLMVEDCGYSPIISHTTRPIRPSEQDGREYKFISKDRDWET